jgi:hypothetical protein
MRAIIVFILLFLLLVTGCEQDARIHSKKYPFVIMKEIIANENGAEFLAEVLDLGNSPILSYGFIWSASPDFQYSYSYSNSGAHEITIGNFSLNVTSDLKKGTPYNVRPFIQTDGYLVYGNSMYFKSEGSSVPVISYFEPKNGNYGDTVVIYGENFSVLKSRVTVSLGNDKANVISTGFNEIKFVIPQKLSVSGEVSLFVKSGETLVKSDEQFSLDGHRITGFNPKEGIIGETEVEITGTGFDPKKTLVWFGKNKAQILYTDETKIKVKLPYSMETGSNSVKVDIDGKMAISDTPIQIKSRWIKLIDFPGQPRVFGSFTVVDDYCYLLTGMNDHANINSDLKDFWRYNISSDQWENLGNFPGIKRSSALSFTIGKELYFGLGQSVFTRLADFWKYNIQTKTWTQLKDFPGGPRYDVIYYTLNNKGYILGGDGTEYHPDVWQYEPDSDKWTKLGNLPFSFIDSRDAFYQAKSKAYLMPIFGRTTNDIRLYEFDPANTGSFLVPQNISLPGTIGGDRLPAFVLNDQFYVLGNYGNTEAVFWKYDFNIGKWTRLENFPGGCRKYSGYFSNDGLGYIVFGSLLGYSVALSDIWRYNPDSIQ